MKRAVVLAAVAVAGCGAEAPASPPAAGSRETVAVERTDLVDRESLSGTLGYADPCTLAAGVAGTLTAVRRSSRFTLFPGPPMRWVTRPPSNCGSGMSMPFSRKQRA